MTRTRPAPSSGVYGVVMELPARDLDSLYAEPSVRAYECEQVQVVLLDTNEMIEADCYNLPRDMGLTGSNPTYARELVRLVESLEFDAAYAREIAAFVTRDIK